MTPELKVSRAMTRLVLHHPFYGSLAMGSDVSRDDTMGTAATNGDWIKWSGPFIDTLTEPKTLGLIAHEVLHIALRHHLRKGDRDHHKWNIACDAAINNILKADGFELPDGGIDMPLFADYSAEKIYDLLPDDIAPPAWGLVFEPEMSEEEKKQEEIKVQQRVIMASAMAKGRGKLPGWADEMIREMQDPEINFEDAIRRHLTGDQPDDYSMRRPNRKMYHISRIIAPTSDRKGVGHIVIHNDTSGSVSDKALTYFLGAMNALAEELRPASITVIACDYSIQSVTRYEEGEPITMLNAKGRGGTRVRPVFDYIEDHQIEVDHFISFTDLEINDFPKDAPDYPVLWVSCGLRYAPFGQVIKFNMKGQ